jgi:MFS family permease
MVAPVVGAVVGGMVATQPYLLFLLPGAVALVTVLIFVGLFKDPDSSGFVPDDAFSLKVALSKYVYNPKKYPDFSWNWLGRFLFFFGLTLNTSFMAFFLASRLNIPVNEIGGTVATFGGVGILGTIGGVFFGGFLSDKLHRRKGFVLGAGLLFGLGSIIMVTSHTLPLLLVGSVLGNISIGIFSAVDQALFLDVLPERDTEAGRFINITQFATTIPQALAPLIGAVLITIGASGADKNYSIVYVAAAVTTIIGGLVILKVRSVR